MIPILLRYRLTLGLATVNLLLMAVVATELWRGTQTSGEEESEAPSAAPAATPDVHVVPKFEFRLAPLASYREIVERSLFVSTRQAAPSDEVMLGESSQTQGPPPFVLVGIVVHPNVREALLRQTTGSRVLRVPEGKDASGGWRVAKVNRDSVLLRRGGQSQELKLKKSQKKPENGAVPPQAQPATPPARAGSESPPARGAASTP